jgi:RNA exonuclease 4
LSSDDCDSSTSTPIVTIISTRPRLHQQQQQRKSKKNQLSSQKKKQQQQNENEVQLSFEEKARYLALDCEMVGVGHDGKRSSVARVTLVDWDGRIVWDEFVRQEQEVTDYRTFVSGITPLDMEVATLTFDECRQKVQEMISDKILVGHALKNDMRALNITHPWSITRDTAKYEPFMKTRFDDAILWPRKLKDLAFEKLQGRKIQREGEPHSAHEDAAAAMALYRTVRTKWEKVMDYKISKTNEVEQKRTTITTR